MNGRTTPRRTGSGQARVAVILFAMLAIGTVIAAATAEEFSDVPKWNWAWSYIQGVRESGVAGGYADGSYQPSAVVSRDQMAVFVSRAMCDGDGNVPAGPATATFGDVPNTGYGSGGTDPYWAFKYVEYAAANHVVAGYEDGLYHPDWQVTRGQMAAFLARAMCGGDESVPEPSGSSRFPDVTPESVNSWCRKYVEYIAGEGVTLGYPDGLYHPELACSRDQMAVYICRAFGLSMPAQPYNVTDYMPLVEGSSWVYETNKGMYTRTISGTQALFGQTYAKLTSTRGETEYWQAQPDGLRLGGMTPSGEGTTSYNPSLYIANGLDPGDQGSQTSPTFIDGSAAGDTAFSYEFVGVETLTISAGTFENCMKLHLRRQTGTEEAREFYLWLAKGVGIVKLDSGEFGGDKWEVLVSAEVGGKSYPANKGPFRLADYRPLDVGSTLVYTGSDGTSVDQIVGVDRIGEIGAARIARGPAEGTPARQYLAVLDGALSFVGEYLPDSSTLRTFSPPMSFPTMPSVGDYGSTTAQVYDGETAVGPATFSWAVVGAGPVSTEAGEFDNCLKLRLGLSDPSGGTQEFHLWLAVGVGVVKEDTRALGGTYWRELIAGKVLGVEFPLGDRLFDITDYVDLTLDNEWKYGEADILSTIVTGTTARGGYDWALLGNPSAIDAPFRYVRTDELGLHELGMLGGAWNNFEYDAPLLLANGLAAGDGGGQTSAYIVNGSNTGDARYDYVFDGIEAVSTDAGLFPDCMKVSYTLHLPTMATAAAEAGTKWFARGVGRVSSEIIPAPPQDGVVSDALSEAVVNGVHYPPGDTAFTMTDYLPVELGNEWAYLTEGEGGYRAVTVVVDGIQPFLDGLGITDTVYKLSRYEETGYGGSDLMAVRSDGVGIYGYVDPSSGAMVVNPPIVIPNGAKVGDSGVVSSTAYVWATDHWTSGGAMQAFWEVADAGPVTTLAGHFPDCVLVRWGVNSAPTGNMVQYTWYARGVGIVKRYEAERGQWEEVMGATIGGQTIPTEVAAATPVDASIPVGTSVGFDFSSGGTSAQPDDQDLNYVYNTAQDALMRSFDTAGISRYVGSGQNGFDSIRAYSTFLPPGFDLWGQAWMQEGWVLGIGWDSLEKTAVVKTREGRYALVYLRDVSASQLDITYVYPYGFFGQ